MEHNKEVFLQSINSGTKFDSDFFKIVYGYSLYDKEFISRVAVRLGDLKRGDVCKAYNEWLHTWKQKQRNDMQDISKKYQEQCNEQWERKIKNREKVNKQWGQDKIQLLKRKKELLAKKRELLNS